MSADNLQEHEFEHDDDSDAPSAGLLHVEEDDGFALPELDNEPAGDSAQLESLSDELVFDADVGHWHKAVISFDDVNKEMVNQFQDQWAALKKRSATKATESDAIHKERLTSEVTDLLAFASENLWHKLLQISRENWS